jgi:hypothetical protein
MIRIFLFFLVTSMLLFLLSCRKDKEVEKNPYLEWKTDEVLYVGEDNLEINAHSIAGLHHDIFSKTCANSGCHDGNFEPDFRTIESAYNTLIDHNAIKTDPDNPQYIRRVAPGEASKSMLVHRLKHNILSNSGIMPLSVDPDSDWNEKKNEYIQRIEKWIDEGAKDVMGNNPGSTDIPPQLQGMLAFANGSSTALNRMSKYGAVPVPQGTNTLKLMFAYSDDNTQVNQFSVNKIGFSITPLDFPVQNERSMSIQSAYNEEGLFGSTTYYHTVTFNVSELGNPGDVIWLQTIVSDNVNEETLIPSPYSIFNYKTYFALVLQ